MTSARWIVSYCLLLLLAAGAGCQLFGLAAYTVLPRTVKQEYTPPKTPMLVLVESARDPGMLVPEAEHLTACIVDDLEAFEVAPMVDWRGLQKMREADPDMPKRSISEIGKKMGAQQVLYVDLSRAYFGAAEGLEVRGKVEARVRVVDVATGKRVYPITAESRQILVETPLSRDFRDTDVVAVQQELLQATGITIGRLFHKWDPGK